ncbi:MAG TPA: S8 family serine peptidase [Longimicrobiales bacterium]|nr:S8 family serine peptidase [Longimicrobiales bacterium]
MRARGPRAAWFLLIGLVACDAPRGTGPAEEDPMARVGPGVAAALGEEPGARVMVALDPAALAGGRGAAVDPARLQREVGALVDGVLDRVGTEGLVVSRRYAAVPALALVVRSDAALARLAADPAVLRIDLDVGGTGGLATSLPQIGADGRHARGNDGAGVVVAILDTGVDTDHPALVGRVAHQACFGRRSSGAGFCPNGSDRQTGDGAAEDDAGHGTHVTGIAAGSGVGSAPGVAPAATLVAVKVLDDCSFSGCFDTFSEIVAALDHLIVSQPSLNVRVINMSLGTAALFSGVCDQSTAFNMAGAQAINTLRGLGVLALAASLNNGSGSQMSSPACLQNVIAVGAVDADDAVAAFSNGNEVTDLVAPGVGIRSLARGGGTLSASGTSMATPHAAGCAALLVQASPTLSPADMAARLRTSPVHVTDPKNGLTLPRLDCRPATDPPDPVTTVTIERPGGP